MIDVMMDGLLDKLFSLTFHLSYQNLHHINVGVLGKVRGAGGGFR